jgi:colanic acid/amylovoran biosynthesis glycosyltransferase
MKEEHRVAYVVSRFPGLSETFILREMCEMERSGWSLELYPLVYMNESVIHDEARSWMDRARRPSLFNIAEANIQLMFTQPLLYLSILFRVFLENILSPKFLSRAIVVFPKAVWMARQMTAEKITHVHSHYATHSALAAWIINQISGIPYGITVHAHDIFVDKSMLLRKILDAKYIVAISEFNREFLGKLFGNWVIEKTFVIHCGISPEMYLSKGENIYRPETYELLSIGSLRSYKGFTFLLDACSLIKRNGVKFHCRIIGGGELSDFLAGKIRKLGLGDVVELVGPKNQKEVSELLRTVDCYVQPSVITSTGKMEGIPVSLMEAMASKLPAIATKISGIPELVRHGETGWLIPPEDPQSLADAIMQVRNCPQEALRRAQAGRDLVLNEFNITITTRLLSNLFNETFKDAIWK